jgi:hypothetical protein
MTTDKNKLDTVAMSASAGEVEALEDLVVLSPGSGRR